MNIINVSVNFEKRQIQRTGVNLTSGDYNSTKIVFEFDKDYAGRKVFELANPSGDVVLLQEIPDNNEVVLVGYIDEKEVSIFNEVGKYIFEISLYEENSKLTSASSSLKIKQEQIVVGDEVVQAYLPIFDTLMQDVEKSIASLENVEKEVSGIEELRKNAEIERENSEKARVESETARKEAEANRATAETTRQNNETVRKTVETEREKAESARADAEITRNSNEEIRQKNEETRINNEISRQTNELSRINNEEQREEKIRMIENALKDVTVEGTNINIQDSADWYAKIKLKGKSEQNGTPTPNTPIEIENIEGKVEVKVIGKNIFDKNKIVFENGNIYNDDGIKASSNVSGYTNMKIPVLPNTNYYRSGIFTSENVSTAIYFYDANKNWISRQAFDLGVNNASFTTPDNCYYIDLQYNISSINWDTVQIEKSELLEPTDYEEYKEQIVYFPLAEGQKLMEGSYLADDGIHTDIPLVLDGTENWFFSASQGMNRFYMTLSKSALAGGKEVTTAFCTHFKYAYDYENYHFYISTDKTKIFFNDNDFSTIEEWKAYLAEQYANGTPVMIEYDLVEEEIIPYTEEQQEAWDNMQKLKTYKTVTNIISDAPVEVTYKKDLQTQLNELQALILESEV